uniref:RRM domain-containing protein n=1 Tax=Leersia perrieri TaxID=77586 RepID=A0A0D9VGQ0_9ORYZ
MSLHIGQLSPDVRQGYLEHLFQRFGNCTVRLKDGYGFAEFDSNNDAARAMRALHGKFVCGKRITVNWSKQQRRFPKDFRSSRIADSSHSHRRAPRDGNFRSRDSIAQNNRPASHDQGNSPDGALEKKSSDGALEKKSSDGALEKKSSDAALEKKSSDAALEKKFEDDVEDLKDVRGTVGEDPMEMKRNEDGTNDANAIEHDRWLETGKGNHGRDDDFDRYEPYHGYVRQEERGRVVRASSHETYHNRHSSQKSKEYPAECFDMNHDKSKSPPAVYNHGAAGHIPRDCSQKTDGKFEEWRDALIRQEEKMPRLGKSESTLRRQPAAHDSPQKTDGKFEAWRDAFICQREMVVRPTRFGSASRRHPEESHVDMVVETHHTIQDVVQDDIKQFSDGTRSAQKLRNVSREDKRHIRCSEGISSQAPKESRKRSRSKRSRWSSLSAGSTTSCSRSRCSHSRSCSCSRAHSPSHSAYSSSKSSQPTQPKRLRSVAISNVNYPAPLPPSGSPQHNSPSVAENKNLDFLVNSPLAGNLDFKTATRLKHMCDYQQEAPVVPFKLKIQSNGESTVFGHDANVDGCTATNLNKNMVHDDNFANGVESWKTNSENASSVKSNKDILVKNGGKSLKLTTIEVVSALKHYGMEAHGTDLRNQPVEKYFGAARLWPWEVIYYRKLKKGPISTENYAKRLEQNKKYSIVDQYVRSSSGWWECH